MPQIFKVGSYLIYFWSNESKPLEPIHVHVAKGEPTENATKIWITKNGNCLLANNRSKIPERHLRYIIEVIEARSKQISDKWYAHFGTIQFYC